MEDRFNTIAGWALFAGIVGLGLNSVSSHYFSADKPHRPHHMGYEIEGVEAEGGAEEGPPLATLLASADVAKGEAIFAKCTSCHTINAGGAAGIGPNLHGVMGKTIGTHAAGFAYSDALKSHGGNWTWENMDAWLKSPKAFANGTKMTFAGLGKAEDRAALLLYLNSQGSNLPLPAAPAADAAAPAEGEAAAAAGTEAPAEGAAPAGAAAAPADAAAAKAVPAP
jgi:cytochrome c